MYHFRRGVLYNLEQMQKNIADEFPRAGRFLIVHLTKLSRNRTLVGNFFSFFLIIKQFEH